MLAILGIFILGIYIPTVYKLSNMPWWVKEYSHAPLIFVIFFWLIWQEKKVFQEPVDQSYHPGGALFFLIGLFLYWIGARHHTVILEAASMPFVIMGAYYFLLGKASLKWLFPATYLIFVVPPPLFLVDAITFPLKKLVSVLTVIVLKTFHYPIFRKGVLLMMGDYKLLVADACSGMRSMISLLALISLYVYMQKAPLKRRFLVLISIIPIAIIANTIRVTSLALITYHYGEAAGQSYYHDFSGFVVFAFALVCIVAVDKLTQKLLEPQKAQPI